jgi:C-terminal processing protease CtpA/Prc
MIGASCLSAHTSNDFQQDFDTALERIAASYAYFDAKATRWNDAPRGDFTYARPVAVLVNRWTGSMGEGLAMGFETTEAGKVVGTAMAGLVGATTRIVLPCTGIGISLPVERLYNVNGTPREEFRPAVLVDVAAAAPGRDPFVEAALRVLAAE